MTKKTTILMVTLVVLTMVVSGCGKSQTEKQSKNQPEFQPGNDNQVEQSKDTQAQDATINTPDNTENAIKAERLVFKDIKEWKTYRDEDLGIILKYPNIFEIERNSVNNAEKKSDIFAGEKITIRFMENDKLVFLLSGYTEDYKGFKEHPYIGGKTAKELCPEELVYNQYGEVCEIKDLNNQKIVFENNYSADEGVFVFVRVASVNNQSASKFKGLEFINYLNDVNINLEKYWPGEEKIFFDKVKEQSENIINKKNLSKDDLEFLEVFEKIILSLKFID